MSKKLKFLLGIPLVTVGIIAGVLYWPVRYHVERSIVIELSPEESFSVVVDFNQWATWSPLLVIEPDALVSVTGDGKSIGNVYSWAGELVGRGELEHKMINAPEFTEMEIRYSDPISAVNVVSFRVEPVPGNSEQSTVFWMMDGRTPASMKEEVTAWVGHDYERGLRMLKEYCETGKVLTKTIINGTVTTAPIRFIGTKQICSCVGIVAAMEKSFNQLRSQLKAAGIEPEGHFLSIYREFDMEGDHVTYIAAYPVESEPKTIPEGMFYEELPAHKALKVTHQGPFRNVANGWAAGMQHIRANRIKQSKTTVPYELMPVDQSITSEADIRSEIFFPLAKE